MCLAQGSGRDPGFLDEPRARASGRAPNGAVRRARARRHTRNCTYACSHFHSTEDVKHLLQVGARIPTCSSSSRLAQYANTNIFASWRQNASMIICYKVGTIRQHKHLFQGWRHMPTQTSFSRLAPYANMIIFKMSSCILFKVNFFLLEVFLRLDIQGCRSTDDGRRRQSLRRIDSSPTVARQ